MLPEVLNYQEKSQLKVTAMLTMSQAEETKTFLCQLNATTTSI